MLPLKLVNEAYSIALQEDPTEYSKKRLIKMYLRAIDNINCPIDKIKEDSVYFEKAFSDAKKHFLKAREAHL